MNPRLQFFAFRDPTRQFAVCVYIQDRATRATALPVVMQEAPEGTRTEPAFELQAAEAQSLMDALWDAGARPTAGHGSAGQKEALENHLKDLQEQLRRTNEHLTTLLGRTP